MAVRFDQFKEMLLREPLDEFVTNRLFSMMPHIFQSQSETYVTFKRALSSGLGVDYGNVVIIGSALLGFSAKPRQFGRPYRDGSDVDVIIVSELLFEQAWADLLRWQHLRNWSMPYHQVQQVLTHHKISVYWGHVWPDLLRKICAFTPRWTESFRQLSRTPELAGFEFKGRLYKSWNHAMFYHAYSLQQIRAKLRSTSVA
jgi:hypothetical protein